jgi:RNA polymerase sigma factor (sigma-70 family)
MGQHYALSFSRLRQWLGKEVALADDQLVRRFAAGGDRNDFAVIVQRYGPLVLGVCRRQLRRPEDVEDAFQTTFLIFARKVRSIRQEASLGSWLHGVAYRVAARMRGTTKATCAAVEEIAAIDENGSDLLQREVLAVLDSELQDLPDKYRLPLLLCHLEEKTHEEAARQLGIPLGSMSRRLSRGLELLRIRLQRRGLHPTAGALAGAVEPMLRAPVPTALQEAAVELATQFALGKTTTATRAVILAEAILRAEWLGPKIALIAGGLLLVVLGSASLTAHQWRGKPSVPAAPPPAPVVRSEAEELAAFRKDFCLRGERIVRTRFGPFTPGPVEAEIVITQAGTWLDGGLGFLLLLTNLGNRPVELTGTPEFDSKGQQRGGIFVRDPHRKTDTEVGLPFLLPAMTLAPGSTTPLLHYLDRHHLGCRKHELEHLLRLVLRGQLRQGERTGELCIEQSPEQAWHIRMRKPNESELHSASREVVELGLGTVGPPQFSRLRYLLGLDRDKPLTDPTAAEMITVYERQAARHPPTALLFLRMLERAGRPEDVLAFAAQRVREGDGLPLVDCAAHLPREMMPCIVAGLDHPWWEARQAAVVQLRELRHAASGPRVARLLGDPEAAVRREAAIFVGRLDTRCAERVIPLLNDPNEWVAHYALEALLRMEDARSQLPTLRHLLWREDLSAGARARGAVLQVIGRWGHRDDAAMVARFFSISEGILRAGAARALGDLGAIDKADEIAQMFSPEDMVSQPREEILTQSCAAAYALGKLRSRKHVPLLAERADGAWSLGPVAVEALADIGDEEAIEQLRRYATDRPLTIARFNRSDAIKALGRTLPPRRRFEEMQKIIAHRATTEDNRALALEQLRACGDEVVPYLRGLAGKRGELGTEARWQLSRCTAPKHYADERRIPLPFVTRELRLDEVQRRTGLPVRIEAGGNLGRQVLPIPYWYGAFTLANLFHAVDRIKPDGSVGAVLTEQGLRVVPRLEAVQFYQGVKSHRPSTSSQKVDTTANPPRQRD